MQVCIFFEVKTAAKKTLCWRKRITKCKIKQTSSGITKPVFMTSTAVMWYRSVQNRKRTCLRSEHCFTHRAKLSGKLNHRLLFENKAVRLCPRTPTESQRLTTPTLAVQCLLQISPFYISSPLLMQAFASIHRK